MDGSAFERDLLALADFHGIHLGNSESILGLARELSLGDGAVVDFIVAVRNWVGHDDVGFGGGGKKRSSCEESGAERHLESDEGVGNAVKSKVVE